jgi:hypothetical protein
MHFKLPHTVDPNNLTAVVGHGGADYGSIALVTGYNQNHFANFSISIATNSVAGMNCSEECAPPPFIQTSCAAARCTTMKPPPPLPSPPPCSVCG